MKINDWNYPYKKKIIAIDFDGTITLKDNRKWRGENYTNDIMEPRQEIIDKLKSIRNDYYFILWTNRWGKGLESAIQFCKNNGIEFDAINENIVPFKSSAKIVADYYLDDKALNIKDFLNI